MYVIFTKYNNYKLFILYSYEYITKSFKNE